MPDPILNITFGDGTPNPGPALPAGKTDYIYTTSICPAKGEYTIAKNNISCAAANGWDSVFLDHTFLFNERAYDGYMMFINTYSPDFKLYYVDTVKGLCDNSNYLFTAAVRTLGDCIRGSEGLNIQFRVETLSGGILDSAFNPRVFTPSLRGAMGFYFHLPAGETGVVLKLLNRFRNTEDCSKISIDDIHLRPSNDVPQKLDVSFANSSNFVTSVCYQANATIPMTARIGGFANPAIQWQQSMDAGLSWKDIPGATGNVYAPQFSVPNTFLFRIRGSEADLIGNPNCSMVSNYIRVQVDGIPANIKITSNSPVCAGSPLKFNADGQAAGYVWTGPNGFTDVIPYPNINQCSLADSGMYYIEITSIGGCKGRDSTYVTIIGTDVRVNNDTAICKGNAVRLRVTGGVSYSWSPASSLSDPGVQTPIATPTTTTLYTVKVSDLSGCTDTASVRIQLLNSSAVDAKFESPDYLCRPADTATFIDQSLGVIANWNWNFQNGQTSSLKNPPQQNFIIGNNLRTFIVSLAIMDTAGCTDTAYHLINVADNCYIAVPSAFTPNGDGTNDFLYPVNAYKAKDLIFRVFSRNGKLIFETRDWTKKWDGTVKGVSQSTGVFVWTLDYTDAANKRINLKGTTTLIR